MEQLFQYRSHIQEIPRIRRDIELLQQEWSIPESEIRQILVIVEELFSNIVRFAFKDDLEHFVEIRMANNNDQVEIEMIDDGIPFNPMDYQKGTSLDPVKSDPGGMGLTLIKAFSSSISYQRVSHKNHLVITKKLKRR